MKKTKQTSAERCATLCPASFIFSPYFRNRNEKKKATTDSSFFPKRKNSLDRITLPSRPPARKQTEELEGTRLAEGAAMQRRSRYARGNAGGGGATTAGASASSSAASTTTNNALEASPSSSSASSASSAVVLPNLSRLLASASPVVPLLSPDRSFALADVWCVQKYAETLRGLRGWKKKTENTHRKETQTRKETKVHPRPPFRRRRLSLPFFFSSSSQRHQKTS